MNALETWCRASPILDRLSGPRNVEGIENIWVHPVERTCKQWLSRGFERGAENWNECQGGKEERWRNGEMNR